MSAIIDTTREALNGVLVNDRYRRLYMTSATFHTEIDAMVRLWLPSIVEAYAVRAETLQVQQDEAFRKLSGRAVEDQP